MSISDITVEWDRVDCLQRNSEIIQYGVTYAPTSDRNNVQNNYVSVNNRMYTATRLQPRTTYIFNVWAESQHSTAEDFISLSATTTVTTSIPDGIPKLTKFYLPLTTYLSSSIIFSLIRAWIFVSRQSIWQQQHYNYQ